MSVVLGVWRRLWGRGTLEAVDDVAEHFNCGQLVIVFGWRAVLNCVVDCLYCME